jgi:KUP system potassium uptake protein
MSTDPAAATAATGSATSAHEGGHHAPRDGVPRLALGALGVVFGDIGTSPLYAFKETFVGHHPIPVDQLHVYGVVSLIFWSIMLVVTVKYVSIIMRADNRGEGGSLALLALISRLSPNQRRSGYFVLLGVLATALFFGDAMITPAMTVMSAVEGLTVVQERLSPLVVPIAILILAGLFLFQSRGTARVGALFGPVMLLYFATLAALGLSSLVERPEILLALSPHWAFAFLASDPAMGFFAFGSIVLAVTGAEALYADMGHFGRRPITLSWAWIVLPSLMLNYLGQAALLMDSPAAAENPFFLMAPEALRLPLVGLATLAAIIASQAVITGTFSVTRQAIQLGFLPRLRITHTSAKAEGQVFIPIVNWMLATLVIALVLGFKSSSNLAAAYGIAVTGTMFIDTLLLGVLLLGAWKWNRWLALPLLAVFLVVDGLFFASNLTKVPDGGWFPLVIGLTGFTLLTTWARGRKLMQERLRESAMPIEVFIKSASSAATRVPGTAVFMTSSPTGVPPALLHNLKHNKVLHERIMILTVVIDEVPYVSEEDRIGTLELGQQFYRIIVRYGFMDAIDIPAVLKRIENCGPRVKMMETSFFLSRQTLLASDRPGMAIWREHLFSWMMRNAESAMDFFRLPTNRVVELGSQVEI